MQKVHMKFIARGRVWTAQRRRRYSALAAKRICNARIAPPPRPNTKLQSHGTELRTFALNSILIFVVVKSMSFDSYLCSPYFSRLCILYVCAGEHTRISYIRYGREYIVDSVLLRASNCRQERKRDKIIYLL